MKAISKLMAFSLAAITLSGSAQAKSFWDMVKGEDNQDPLVFTTGAIKATAEEWNAAELEKRSHPLMLEAVSKSGITLTDYFKMLQKLGKLKKDPECRLSSQTPPADQKAPLLIANYVCDVQYEAGPAQLTLESRRDKAEDAWKLTMFKVDSPVFAAAAQNQNAQPAPAADAKEKSVPALAPDTKKK